MLKCSIYSSTCTQQAECSAKRRHLETPNEKSTLAERQNASFSQPTKTEDLLLTQHIDMSQTNSVRKKPSEIGGFLAKISNFSVVNWHF